MTLDAELEREGFNNKARARFFNRIWHPFLPRKVFAMQWLVLTQGLPVGEWREKIGLPYECELCPIPIKETLQHALKDCPQLNRAWDLFRNTRQAAGLPPSYYTWKDISRGLMREPPGPQVEEELRWDTASAFSINSDTPWDVLRAQLLWSIWCQRVAHTFRDETFHLGLILWHAWRNTIYCAMEAYKELFKHKRNKEKRQELIKCFQQIWTAENIFGRLQNNTIKWNVTPHQEFLPKELGAWTIPPIRINRLSPSPDIEAEFVARPDFPNLVDEFLNNVSNNWQPPPEPSAEEDLRDTPASSTGAASGHSAHTNTLGEHSQQRDHCTTHMDENDNAVGETMHTEEVSATPIAPMPQNTRRTPSPSQAAAQEKHSKEQIAVTNFACLPSPKVRKRPHSRSKRRCSRKHHHPMSRHRRESFVQQHLQSPVTNNKQEHAPHCSPRNPHTHKERTPSPKHTEREKPKSRPKCRCRFGPWVRRVRNSQHQRTRSLNASHSTHYSQDHGSQDSPLNSQTEALSSHPVRVTFQPLTKPKRTPFDSYKKNKEAVQGSAMNTSKFAARRMGISEQEFEEALTNENYDLLEEIDLTRRAALDAPDTESEQIQVSPSSHSKERRSGEPYSPPRANTTDCSESPESSEAPLPQGDPLLKVRSKNDTSFNSGRLVSRHKQKCYFGPRKLRGRDKLRTSPSRRDAPPPPPSGRTPTSGDDGGKSPFGEVTSRGLGSGDRIRPTPSRDWTAQELHPQEVDDAVVLPNRPTFFHFTPPHRSPFARYLKLPAVEPRPPPFRSVHERLGLSEEEFKARLQVEIDNLLAPLEEPCDQAGDLEGGSHPSITTPTLSVMTKEDGLRFLRNRALTIGSLLGMFRWAADLGWARYCYDFDFNRDDTSLLEAFDI
jgi:hypothetical protein